MKKILLGLVLLGGTTAFAQLTEDFEGTSGGALPAGWTQVSAATDGGYATSTDMSSTYWPVPTHTIYAGTNDDACDCDKSNEQLISAAFTVPANGVLSFEYALPGQYGETVEVGISTDGGVTNTQVAVLAANGGTWGPGTANMGAYAGQMVNVVWTYDDAGAWAFGFMLDDITTFVPSPVDLEMTSLNIANTVVAGNVDIAGTVTSWGATTVTSLVVAWEDGGVPNSATFPVNLNYGDTYNFTHTTQLTAVAGSAYSLNVCAVEVTDADMTNNCLATTVSAVSSLVPKVTVGEEKTGEWCGWCPRGAVGLE
ncbi:MAG: hypothetical protein HRT57_01035, partial [Crocinitomicaceae bacterium]|nr:hypothetical protein [Crocinitomicaceae bacterium]